MKKIKLILAILIALDGLFGDYIMPKTVQDGIAIALVITLTVITLILPPSKPPTDPYPEHTMD